ncbi:Occludin/RNA polymerase II elongation factor, ELL domain and Vacuolar ATPase assembly integral membrane protein VMA21-like domain and Origin recognition complex, subunit 3 family-containing protein [Strongyloides ratti]|uniref:Occludin/RNA polymerase II elongation factor, ELL domain and Vacuolar ATPase assembly integral membrane protein VMA21-like domain and Origin recognition complex, subunit 3 family-containing protein n=1 Tax=Strongyloides ratti TaxID=34506 RepID=A0A090LEZ6_STRRB|nr:Occludin/RNA polymerase II elongation factor, ELL domain and Vacuolar ATPase assembly integral membrane protein VMA21-like domain and Origin recognition complex, subunit 3 family-containing protein [Strongyloides ratti]CEF68337.1 Occludin/RNA polymerase II elongation factor, ELL domain and Vacuolar ATPase assembly integral membrane protein VMA21-like domain and Origin recognition complex, subunit 3 family-containing protein [Strongyloides ratti]
MEDLLKKVEEAIESSNGLDNLDEVIKKFNNTKKDDLIPTIIFERGFCDVTRRLENLSNDLIVINSNDQLFDIPTFIKLLLARVNNIFSASCNSVTDLKHFHLPADRTEKLYIIIKHTESFPSVTIDKIISTLYEVKLPVILICCVSTSDNSLFVKCSRSNYLLLDVKYASINSPEIIFDGIWNKIQLDKTNNFIFDYEIIDKARETFFNYSYSIKDVHKYLELSIAFHFSKIKNGHVITDKSNNFSYYKNIFVDTLTLLHEMTKEYYSKKSIWYLYSMICTDKNLFDTKNDCEFNKWLSMWNVWCKEKLIEYLERIKIIINMDGCDFLESLCCEVDDLLKRLNTLDSRIADLKNQPVELTNIKQDEIKKTSKKNKNYISRHERAKKLMDRMEHIKNCDLFSKDKKDIFAFLSLFFKTTFNYLFDATSSSYYFIKYAPIIQTLTNPPSDYFIDIDLNHLLNNSDQYFNPNTTDILDVPLSYKILQSLTNIHSTKPISIEKWKQAFINDCSSDDKILLYSEVEIVNPEDCTDNGKKEEKSEENDLNDENKEKSEHNTEDEMEDTENETENNTCDEEENMSDEEIESETEEDKWYGSDSRKKAINNLIYYSILMFVFPLLTMYLSYQFVFIDYFYYDTDTAAMYSGLIAAGIVYIVIISFIWEAYNEEKDAEVRKKALKSD